MVSRYNTKFSIFKQIWTLYCILPVNPHLNYSSGAMAILPLPSSHIYQNMQMCIMQINNNMENHM